MKKNYFFLILFLLLAGIFHVQQAQAQNVAQAGYTSGMWNQFTQRADPRTTIQAAVNDAQNGDQIRILADVTTTAEVTIDKSLTFRSNDNTNRTVSNHTFIITDPNVTLTMRTSNNGRINLNNSTITTNIPDYYVVSATSGNNTTYSVRNEVARVGNTTNAPTYTTVQAAVDAATAGSTIYILTDVSTTTEVTIDKSLTFRSGNTTTTGSSTTNRTVSNHTFIITGSNVTLTMRDHGTNNNNGRIILNNSTITTNIPDYYVVSANATGSNSNTNYTVSNQVAFIGTTPYTSLEAAVTAAVSGNVIEVQTNLTAATTQDITVGDKSITIASKSGSNFSLSNYNFILTEATSSLALNSSLTLASDVQITTNVAGYHVENAPSGDNTVYTISNKVARIGETYFTSLPEAITAATSGATITIVANITPDAVANITLDKSLTITAETPGQYTIADHHFTLSGNTVEVTVSNLNFSGDSYINANNGKGLTVDRVNATVNPAKVPNNSRSAFIVLSTSESTTGLDFTLTNSNIVNTFGTDYYGAYVFGWAYLSSANISNNTFGSADYRCRFVAVKLMNVTDGTEYHFSDNTFYGTTDYSFAAFDLYQNNSRANSYTAWGENNVLDVEGTDPGVAYVIERNGNANAQIVVLDKGTTINGTPITTNDFENEIPVAQFNGYYAVDVEVSSTGKYMSGTYSTNVSGDQCAEGYAAFANGTDPETWTVAPAYTIYYIANNTADERDTAYVLQSAPTFTVPASTFTNGEWSFGSWNTKADGTGTGLAVNATMTLSSDTTLYAQWQGVAKIGDTHYTTLDAAVDAVLANETIEILVDSCGITNTKVIPTGVTIQGLGKTSTIVTIASTSGSGLTLNNPNVTLKDMTIDGSQIISGDYIPLVNVRADGCLITDVVMKKGGHETWSSSILVETLNSSQTFTVRNSTISGSFRGVLRESCSANIVIDNCDIDAVYPFNIDGGSGGVITVTNSRLHGWTSYSGVDSVTFTNCDFSKATSGYDNVAAYVNTTFNNCTMDNTFNIYAQTQGFQFTLNDCTKNGVLVHDENFTELFPNDPDVWNKCNTVVNEVMLVGKQSQVDDALSAATISALTKMTQSFEYNGVVCGPASATNKNLDINCDTYTLTMKNNGDHDVTLTTTGGNTTMQYTCLDGSIVNVTNASVAISEGTTFTVTDQTTFFKAADGYFLVETDNGGSFTYSVGTLADKVARIGDGSLGTQYFTTLDAAVTAAATATDTIVILQDIADLPQQTIDKDITINLNNHTLSGSTSKLINITAGDVTIKNGNITSTAASMITQAGTGTVTVTNCNLSGTSRIIHISGTGIANANNSVITSTGNGTIYNENGNFNATGSTISNNGTTASFITIWNNKNNSSLNNCTITGPSVVVYYGGVDTVNIKDCIIESKTYSTSGIVGVGTIVNNKGVVNIYGSTQIKAYYAAIQQSNSYNTPGIINFGGYMDGEGNLVASGAPSIILKDTNAATSGHPFAISAYYDGTINIFGNAMITAEVNSQAVAAIGCTNGGKVNFTGGTIEGFGVGMSVGRWLNPAIIDTCKINISDTANLATLGKIDCIDDEGAHPSEIEIWGGVFSEDVSGEKCREGYAAFPLESNPGYFYVAPSYAIFLMANNGTTDKDTCYVRQATGSGVIKANPFEHPSALIFSRWNTKADGTGENFDDGATISGLTHDTTLYAQWRGEAKIGDTHYATLNAAAAAVPVGTPTTITILQNLNFYDIDPSNLANKTITFTGTPTDTLTLTDGTHEQTSASGANLTFETITLKNDNTADVYRGITDANKITFNDCEILGFMMGYAETLIFNNCTFTKTCKYHLWTYGSNCTFNDCTFNSIGNSDCKAVNVYKEVTAGLTRVINFNDCEFNSTPAVTTLDNSAIQINSYGVCFVVNINNCTVNGYINESSSITSHPNLVNNKNTSVATTLYIDGTQIIKQGSCDPVAMIGDTYYNTLQDALNAAHGMTGDVTINIINDEVKTYSIVHQKAGLNVTIEGNNHTVAGQIIVDGNARAAGTETLTIQNVKFQDDKSHFCTGTDAFVVIPSTKTAGAPYYTGAYNYAHNITVDHCSFNSTSSNLDVVGIKATSGATCYNLKMNYVTGDKLHSLAQLTATEGALIDNCTATNTESFVNVSGGGAVDTISNCTFTGVDPSDGYAVRENGGSGVEIYLINNTFKANSVLQLGKDSGSDASGHINVISGNYTGDLNNAQSASGTARFVLKGGTYSEPKATVDNWCAPGYMAIDQDPEPGYCTVHKMYWVTYDGNGATGGSMIPSYVVPTPGTAFTVKANDPDNGDGFTWSVAFTGWNTKADGTGTAFAPGDQMTISSDTTLYAQWNYVATINGMPFSSLQAAVDYANDNLTGDVTINLVKNTMEVVKVLQKADNNLIIEGNGNTLTGQMHISACDANCTCGDIYYDTDSIAIRNLNFSYNPDFFEPQTNADQSIDGEGFIFFSKRTFSPTCNTNYSHNISIRNCNFDGTGFNSENPAYGIYAVSTLGGSVDRFILDHCTVTNALGLAELQSIQHFTVTGNTATNVTRGLTIYNSALSPHTISNNHITATETAFYINYNDSGVDINMAENEVSAPTAFLFGSANAGSACNLDITSGTYIGAIVNNTESNIDFFDISGGTYSNNVTGDPCAEGYAAFANGTDPETWTVTKAWFLHYNANGGTGTMDSAFVKQSDDAAGRTVTVADCNYTYDSYAFAEWNTKADGTGTRVAPGAQFTLTQDTVLYAQWARVKNVTQDKYYNTLQAAINDATAGDSVVVLTDLTTNDVVLVGKNLTINGCGHILTTYASRGIRVTTNNKNVKVKNLTLDFKWEGNPGASNVDYIRGFQIDGSISGVNFVIDSCRIIGHVITYNSTNYPIPTYGMLLLPGASNNMVTVSNSYIWGRAALNCRGSNSKFIFENDTLYGVNTQHDNTEAFGTIVLDGGWYNNPTPGSSDTISLVNSVVIADKRTGADDEMWMYMPYGASDCAVYADANTKFLNRGDNNTEFSDVYIEVKKRNDPYYGTGNSISMYNLTDEEIQDLRNHRHTVVGPDENGFYRISHDVIHYDYDDPSIVANDKYSHSDLYYPTIGANDKITLTEDITLTRNIPLDFNGKFTLLFDHRSATHQIVKNGYSFVLGEKAQVGTEIIVDSLFTSEVGEVTRTGSAGDYTYSVVPYIAKNMNTGTSYISLQTAVDEVNNGDTVRLLSNIGCAYYNNMPETGIIIDNKNLTIDLNSHYISLDPTNFYGLTIEDAALHVVSGNLTIKDSQGGGYVKASKGHAVLLGTSTTEPSNVVFTLNGGELRGPTTQNVGYGLYVNTNDSVVINGGKIENEGGAYISLYNNNGTTNIHGGTIGHATNFYGRSICVRGGVVNIDGGSVISKSSAIQNYATVNVNGGEIHGGNTLYGGTIYCCIYNEGVFTMNNGTVTIDGKSGFESGTDNAKLYIKGGTITDGGSATTTIKLSGGLLEVTGGTIKNTCATATAAVICAGSSIANISGGSITADNACVIPNAESTINITGGTFNLVGNNAKGIYSDNINDKAKIAISGGTFNISGNNTNAFYLTGKDTVNVTGGTIAFTGTNDTLFNTSGNGAVVTIDDITATASTLFNCGATDSLTVNGGIYNTDVDWLINAGKIYLNGGIFTSSNTATAVNNGTLKVNKGWYSANMTSNTRSTKKYIARSGSEEPIYKDETYLIPVDAGAVTAANLTGAYYQLGNTITYHSNDGRDSIIEVGKPIDQTITLLDGMAFAKLGHDMIYWNTEPDRTGVDYALGATSPSDNADLNLYAIWLLRECPEARDADGNVYATVRLGARYTCWMAENLRTTHYSDGRAVANPMALPAYMTPDYPDDDVRDSIFGLLYDWYDAVDTASNDVDSVAVVFNAGGRVHGICPQGWYVPSDRDFAELEPYGGFALRSESYWITQTGNNSTAFNAIPAGYYNCNTGRYENTFGYAVFQTCHPVYDMVSGSFIDYVCDNLIKKLELLPCSGFSVRCVLNDD